MAFRRLRRIAFSSLLFTSKALVFVAFSPTGLQSFRQLLRPSQRLRLHGRFRHEIPRPIERLTRRHTKHRRHSRHTMTPFPFTRGGFHRRHREPTSNPRIININLSICICQEQTDRSSQRTHPRPTHHYQAVATESIGPTNGNSGIPTIRDQTHAIVILINTPLPLIHIRHTIPLITMQAPLGYWTTIIRHRRTRRNPEYSLYLGSIAAIFRVSRTSTPIAVEGTPISGERRIARRSLLLREQAQISRIDLRRQAAYRYIVEPIASGVRPPTPRNRRDRHQTRAGSLRPHPIAISGSRRETPAETAGSRVCSASVGTFAR